MADGGYSARNGARGYTQQCTIQEKGSMKFGEEFPMLCETCLGLNPYVRMIKLPYGQKLCKISNAPYQAFRWKAGPQGRYKETIICFSVAAERNICQTCLNDMKYGLPVGVRDSLLVKQENKLALPQSDVGQKYFYDQQTQFLENGENNSFLSDMQNIVPSRQLDQFSHSLRGVESKNITAFRNLPKLCTFWLVGTCNRVTKKTCPFRPCCGVFQFPEIAGYETKDICKQLIDLLNENGAVKLQKNIPKEILTALQSALKGNKDDAIRKRVLGEDDLSKRYLGRIKSMELSLPLPEDTTVCTLWLGNIEADMNEKDIMDAVYCYGVVINIHFMRQGRCAFVEFKTREMAENAANKLYNSCVIKGISVTVSWAKAKGTNTSGRNAAQIADSPYLPPPPGMEKSANSSYSLPDLPTPVCGVVDPSCDGVDPPHKRRATAAAVYPSMNPARLGTTTGPTSS